MARELLPPHIHKLVHAINAQFPTSKYHGSGIVSKARPDDADPSMSQTYQHVTRDNVGVGGDGLHTIASDAIWRER